MRAALSPNYRMDGCAVRVCGRRRSWNPKPLRKAKAEYRRRKFTPHRVGDREEQPALNCFNGLAGGLGELAHSVPEERLRGIPGGMDRGDQLRSSPIEMGGAGLRAFSQIAKVWGLSRGEQTALLALPEESFDRLMQAAQVGGGVEVDHATLERIGHLLGIYKGLVILLPGSSAEWLRGRNKADIFKGKPPIERMISGQAKDLAAVRQYLQAWYEGDWYEGDLIELSIGGRSWKSGRDQE
jgi:hypothetical protein